MGYSALLGGDMGPLGMRTAASRWHWAVMRGTTMATISSRHSSKLTSRITHARWP